MALIGDLLRIGVLEEKDVPVLEEIFKNNGSTAQDYLALLLHYFERKMYGNSKLPHMVVYISPGQKDSPSTQDQPFMEYMKFVDILHIHELIPDLVYEKLKEYPIDKYNNNYVYTIHLAVELTSHYTSFTIQKQLEFVQLLGGKHRFGIDSLLNQTDRDRLEQDIRAGKLNSYLDFFGYSFASKFIDLSTSAGKPAQLLETLTAILDNLSYSAFQIRNMTYHETGFSGNPEYHNTQASIVLNTGAREHTYTYTYSKNELSNDHDQSLVLENTLSFVNNLLADYNCTYRMAGITSFLPPALFPGGRVVYAICRFQQENMGILDFQDMQKRFLFSRPQISMFKYPLSYTQIEYMLYHIQESGLISHLDEEQIKGIKCTVYSRTYDGISDLLTLFPGTVLVIDRTLTAGQKPYLNFLLALNSISRGVLIFTDINDGLPDHFTLESDLKFIVSFTCNNKRHEVECSLTGKEFHDRIVYYVITEILRKEYEDYELIQLRSQNYKSDKYIFATHQQSEYLKSMKLRDAISRF